MTLHNMFSAGPEKNRETRAKLARLRRSSRKVTFPLRSSSVSSHLSGLKCPRTTQRISCMPSALCADVR